MTKLKRLLWGGMILGLVAGAGTGCTKQAKKARTLARANRDFAAELYDRAEIEYLAVLRVPPPEPTAMARLGMIYYTQGKQPQALVYLREAVKLQPDNAEARLKLGFTQMGFRQIREAREQAMAVLQRQPTNSEGLLLLADSSATQQDIQQTAQVLEKVPPDTRAQAAWHIARGTLYVRQNELDKAENEFKQAIAQDPKSSQAYLVLGNLYILRNDVKQAEPALKKAAELSPLRSNARLRYAELKLKTGAAQEATTAVEDLAKKAPDYLPAWIFLAQAAKAEGRKADCESLVQKILARDRMNYEGLLLNGKLMLEKGDGTNAAIQFERLVKAYGPGAQAEYELALAHIANGQAVKALASLDQAIAANTNFVEAILLQATLNIGQGNPAAAIAPLTALIKQGPQVPEVYLLLAKAYIGQNKRDEAAAVYRGMMDMFPKAPEIPYLLGTLFAVQNKPQEARQAFEKALQLSPDFLAAVEQLVDLDLKENQDALAMERVNKQIEKYPRAPQPWFLVAKIHMAKLQAYVSQASQKNAGGTTANLQLADTPGIKDNLKAAEAALQKAIDLNPSLPTAYQLLAKLYLLSNKQQQALDRLNVLAAKTNDVLVLTQIGIIHEQLKDYPAAAEAYEKAIKANPNALEALNNLAFLYAEHLGQLDRGYALAEKVRRLQPDNGFTADTLGWILYRRGEYVRASALLEESATKLPNDPEIQYHVGMAHYMLGEEDLARLALQRATQGNKDFAGKQEALQRLALLALDVKTADGAVVAVLETRLRETPNDPVALVRLAAIQERDGAFDKAVKTYETALKNNSRNTQVMLKVAQLYERRLNNSPKALEIVKEAHNVHPEDAQISYLLGHLVYKNRDYKWAASLLQESARKMPNDPEVMYDLAWSQYSVGRVAEAQATMQTTAQGTDASAWAQPGKQFLQLVAASTNAALAEQAIPQAQRALVADPDYVPALIVCAVVQEKQGKFSEAAQLFNRVLGLYPLFTPATRNLAMLYFEHLKDDQKAYELATKARETFTTDPDLAKALGVLAYRRQDYSRSAQLLQESSRQRTNDGDLFYYLGMARYRINQRTESKEALLRALALNVPAPLAEEAKRALKEVN